MCLSVLCLILSQSAKENNISCGMITHSAEEIRQYEEVGGERVGRNSKKGGRVFIK